MSAVAPVTMLLKPLASLRLTVTLMAMSMFLIFAGTLAQVNDSTWSVVERYFRSLWVWIDPGLFVPGGAGDASWAIPFPGGFLLAGLLIVNLIAAHAVRFKLTRRRFGIVLLHGGLIVLLLGEFVTGLYATEGNMTIVEGGSANYVEDIRTAELAVIDRSPADRDRVVAIPHALLKRPGQTIRDPRLPFDVTIERWMPNSRLFGPAMAPPDARPEATRGLGTRIAVMGIPRVSGVDGQTVDVPSAIVSLSRDGESLGRWLVSAHLEPTQTVTVGDRSFDIALRFKRTYKPYTMHLIDFRHDKFVGTDKPRNFSSLVRLVDPSQNEDRRVLIYMNNPLRYNGETFYQSAFLPDDSGTVLQVVNNPGWLLPYVACGMVATGLVLQFGMHLIGYVRRVSR